jgi:hypothetical protein
MPVCGGRGEEGPLWLSSFDGSAVVAPAEPEARRTEPRQEVDGASGERQGALACCFTASGAGSNLVGAGLADFR